MRDLLKRFRAALAIGLSWGAAGFIAGGLIELVHTIWPNPLGSMVDIWPAALAIPGFAAGIAFSGLLLVLGRSRRFAELSWIRFALLGAAGGVAVSLVPAALVSVGLVTLNVPLLQLTAVLIGPLTIGGAIAASGTLALARRAEDGERLEAHHSRPTLGPGDDGAARPIPTPSASPRDS